MRVFPIWFCSDVDASAKFLEALGLDIDHPSRSGSWVEAAGSGGGIGVHSAHRTYTEEPRTPGECALNFDSDEPLEQVQQRLFAAGFTDAHIIDETFGRSLRVTGPDGAEVRVNETDPELRA